MNTVTKSNKQNQTASANIAQLLLYRYGLLAIGNDAISIFAFGIAFFSENVETFFVRKFETELTEVKL